MSPQQLINQLLALNGEDWFLAITENGRAEISTDPTGHVVGKIECHQPKKNSSEDSITTAPTPPAVPSLPELEKPVSSLR